MLRKRKVRLVRTLAALIGLLVMLAIADRAEAVLVLRKGDARPVLGYLVRSDERGVVIRLRLADGSMHEQTIPRDQVDELIETVSPKRLAELDPEQPQLYREYAEELAEKRRDPEAHDAAIRLFAIAAWRGKEALRHSALLGLVALARSPDEERRFRAAVFLNDPHHDPAVLLTPGSGRSADGSAPLSDLLNAVRQIRRGRATQVKSVLERPEVQIELAAFTKLMSADELIKAAGAKSLSDAQLAKVLRLELAIERMLSTREELADEESDPAGSSWSAAARQSGLAPVQSMRIESLTEFDPRLSVFRDGKWVAP